jgi:hypothetical protein
MCFAGPVMFVTRYQASSWTLMQIIGPGGAYG